MIQCHEARPDIPKLIDGSLDSEREFLVQHHLSMCTVCRAAFHSYERDEEALTGYVRRAPYAPVARNVIDEIDRQRSPWMDAFRAGSYRLASVAGLVLVILVVGAGAWTLREVATSDPPVDDQPAQNVTLSTSDTDEPEQLSAPETPDLIGLDDADQIVDRLDDAGLVFDADVVSEGDGYSIEYGRIAVDRHFSLVEYSATVSGDDRVYITFMANGGGSQPIPVENGEGSGWLVFHSDASEAEMIELEDGRFDGTGNQNRHEFDFDPSPLPGPDQDRQMYQTADMVNGIELCCLEIEYGVAVSTITRSWEIVDRDELVYVDENFQPVEQPPAMDATAPAVWPTLSVDDEDLPLVDGAIQRGLNLGGDGVGVLNLPTEGLLELTYEHLMLPTDGQDGGLAIFQGSWTLSAQLEEPEAEIEPTPEPTEEPMVADEPTPEPEPEPTPAVADDDDESPETLRVMAYFVRSEELGVKAREIPYTQDVATAAIQELLAGPDEQVGSDVGLHTEIPEGTELLDIGLEDGTLIVDLSSEFTEGGGSASILMRLAQVVHTGTQFDSVDDVQILIEGEFVETIGGEGVMVGDPLEREDFEDQAPAILIESPAPHEPVSTSIRLRGTSNTFEGTLQIEILGPSGDVIYRDYSTASAGTGTRGEFDLTVPVEYEGSGIGAVRMFEHSAQDGERTNVVTIPVQFQ